MMQNLFHIVLLASGALALAIQEPRTIAQEVEEAPRTDSTLFPLLMNPWQVSHWNCFGTTLYENTAISDDYTYNVDVCITAVIAAKLAFPFLYEIHTGNSLLVDLGILSPSSELAEDEYFAPAQEYSAPAAEEYGAPAYQAHEETYGAPQPVYQSFEQRRNGKTPSFQERLTIAFNDLSKAITKNNPLSSYQ